MEKLYQLKKGNKIFYACKYDCGLFTIDRITKGFGGSVACFNSLEDLQSYALENGYKSIQGGISALFGVNGGKENV